MKIQDIVESKRANNIFMRFGVKKPVAAVAGEDADPYVVGYAGFANTPADLKHADAQWKFHNLQKKEDFVKAIKKMMADKTFTAASGVTIYVDNKAMLNKFPGYGEFIAMIEKMGGGKVDVEYKPDSDREKPEKGAGKKRTVGQWADPDAKIEPAEKQTTRYFSVTSPRLMSQLRRNDRIMQYYRPNRNAFVMGPKEFDAFVKAFGRDDIKIVDRFKEEVEETATADDEQTVLRMLNSQSAEKLLKAYKKLYKREYPGTSKSELVSKIKSRVRNYKQAYELISETATAGGTSAGGIAGFAVGIGSPDPKKKKKSKLIRR